MVSRIRVVMLGTPDFAVPTLEALANSPLVDIVLVVTQPDKPVGRKRELRPTAVKQAALARELPVAQPRRVSSPAFVDELRSLQPDLLVTAAYGQILSQQLLAVPKFGCLNVHASLLPRWRGAAPIHRALMAGDKVSGVTIMKTVLELDAGPVLGSQTVPVALDDNVGSLHDKLAQVGATLLLELLPDYVSSELPVRAQDEDGTTYAHRILRNDEWLDFGESAWTLHNHIRGLSPWPGATARFEGKPMKLWESRFHSDAHLADEQLLPETPVGTVYLTPDGSVWLRAGDGWLELLAVQPAGKRRMKAADWLRGQRTSQVQLHSMEENE